MMHQPEKGVDFVNFHECFRWLVECPGRKAAPVDHPPTIEFPFHAESIICSPVPTAPQTIKRDVGVVLTYTESGRQLGHVPASRNFWDQKWRKME